MSSDRTPKAIVENCRLIEPSEVATDLKVTFYDVEARMLLRSNKYSDDVYMVEIIKPEGIGDLMDEEGTLMEHGKFSFESTEELPKDGRFGMQVGERAHSARARRVCGLGTGTE